jgi:hypothetical protein
MADQWQTGQLSPVFIPLGNDAAGNERFRRAPFDLLLWTPTAGGDPEFFVNTVGFGDSLSSATLGLLSDDGDAIQAGHEFGYYTTDQVVTEPHCGDGDGDDWHSVTMFGYL